MSIITEGMVHEAINLVRPAAQAILKTKGLTWGPKWVDGMISIPGSASPILFIFGKLTKWEPGWGEEISFVSIAKLKLSTARHEKANTSAVGANRPWALSSGNYLYAGGAYRDGIAVGVSGAYGWVDEAIATMIIDAI